MFLELVVLLVKQMRAQLRVAVAEVFNDFAQCRSGALKGRFRQLGHANQDIGERDSVHGQLRVQVVEGLKGELCAIPGKQLGAEGLALANIDHQVAHGVDRLTQEQRLVLVFVTEIGADIRVRVIDHHHRVITAKRLVQQQGVGHREGVAVGRAAWVHLGVFVVQFILDIAAQVHAAIGEDVAAAFLGIAAAGVGVDLFQGGRAEDVHVSLA